MITNICRVLVLVVLSWITIFSTCIKGGLGCADSIYSFEINNLGTDMGFVKLINVSPIELGGAVSQFKYILITGSEVPNRHPETEDTLIKNFLIKDVNSRYSFKLGIIPQNSGTFRFNLGNFVGVYRNGNPCPKADFITKLIQTNQHYYLYPGGSGVTPAGADYYFYVR